MSLETQELRKIFAEIQAEFINTVEIQVHPVSGDPPSQYEVTYYMPCTSQDDQGNINIVTNHTITISIPFGFPHFPPSCKPKSPIFHPDFDNAAICLGDYWNRDRTISDLIRHIGLMLKGEIYSTENAFNEEAASWFRENSDQLPFGDTASPSELDISPEPEKHTQPEQKPAFILSLEPEEDKELPEVSIMEDIDFMDDFQFSEDFQEAPGQHPLPPPSLKTTVDTDKLKQLARKRNYLQLERELAAISRDTDFPDKTDLTEKTAFALKQARTLYEEAESYDNQGLSHKAVEYFKAVENLVADYPNIRADISRTEHASDLLKELSNTPNSAKTPTPKPSEHPRTNTKKTTVSTSPNPQDTTEEKGGVFKERVKRPVNIIPYVLTGGILCILAPLTYFYFTLSSHLTEARQLFSECTSNFAEKNFQAAEEACLASLDTTKNIFLIHQSEIAELHSGIRSILDSEEMHQGLQGKVLYNEKYVAKSTLTTHQTLQEMINQGKDFLESSAWDQAAASFQKALELCRQLSDLSPDEQMNIEQNLSYAAFRSMLTVAEEQVDKEAWQAAATTLSELQGQITQLSPQQQAEYRDYIDTLLARSRFTSLKEQADTLFSQSDWAGAASLFQKAVEAGRSLSEKEDQDLSGLQANIARSELYATINAGNSAFAAGQWDAAIEKYKQAANNLETHAQMLNFQEVEQSRKKLDRIMLQSAIIRDRQNAEKSKGTKDVTTTISHLQKVIDTIQTSNFADDPEFKEIAAETREVQQEMKAMLFIREKEQYLVDNYTRLFMQNYPAASPETLNTPIATFEKRIGRLYLFKLQCTESGRGRPLKLIMFYTYDPDNRRWNFYSEN